MKFNNLRYIVFFSRVHDAFFNLCILKYKDHVPHKGKWRVKVLCLFYVVEEQKVEVLRHFSRAGENKEKGQSIWIE